MSHLSLIQPLLFPPFCSVCFIPPLVPWYKLFIQSPFWREERIYTHVWSVCVCGVCMYAHHTLCVVYAHHTWNPEEVTSCSALSPCTLCLSVDLELAWQQASASGPPVSTLYSVGVPGYVAMPGLGTWVWVLTLAQEVLFPLSGLPNLIWYHCSIFMCKRLSL